MAKAVNKLSEQIAQNTRGILDRYTKSETDSLLSSYYTKLETNTMFAKYAKVINNNTVSLNDSNITI